MPVFFDLYRTVGLVCVSLVKVQRNQPGVREICDAKYGLLIGMLFRIAKLMLSNIALASERKFGETIAIIDRCIYESAIKLAWLCDENGIPDKYERYLAEGLKSDLALRREITSNIESRSGIRLPIEERMLASIERSFRLAGMNATSVENQKKLPSLNAMVEELGFERLNYVVGQKIGSQSIHGHWSVLLGYFLIERDNMLVPRDEDIAPHINQFTFNALLVINACEKHSSHFFVDPKFHSWFSSYLEGIRNEIVKHFESAVTLRERA